MLSTKHCAPADGECARAKRRKCAAFEDAIAELNEDLTYSSDSVSLSDEKTPQLHTRVKLVEKGDDFWPLFKNLEAEGSGFQYNITWLLDAFKNGQMYTLELVDTPEMDQFVPLYCCPYTRRIMPCICVVQDNACKILWVSVRLRRKGLATKFVDTLFITKATDIVDDGYMFWAAMKPLLDRNKDLVADSQRLSAVP